jgi:hypothetical protein
VRSALHEIKLRLLEAGLPQELAEAVTESDPKGFWTRLVRWFGGAKPRDALEDALWAALDFVPGGTAVKLGVKVVHAVRKALK